MHMTSSSKAVNERVDVGAVMREHFRSRVSDLRLAGVSAVLIEGSNAEKACMTVESPAKFVGTLEVWAKGDIDLTVMSLARGNESMFEHAEFTNKVALQALLDAATTCIEQLSRAGLPIQLNRMQSVFSK